MSRIGHLRKVATFAPTFVLSLGVAIWAGYLLKYELGALNVFRYAVASAKKAEDAGQFVDVAATQQELDRFRNIPGAATWARGDLITLLKTRRDNPKALEEATRDYLKRAPTSGRAWLELAILTRYNGKPMKETLAALAMSRMTNPREIFEIGARLTFSFSIWPFLPEDERRATISEIVSANPYLGSEMRGAIKAAISSLPEGERASIKAQMEQAGLQPAATALF